MNLRSVFDRVFLFSLISQVKASTLNKILEPRDKVTGLVQSIDESWMNSITIHLESDDRTFFINKAGTKKFKIDTLQSGLPGKQITISYKKSSNSNRSNPVLISQVELKGKIIFSDL